MIMLGCTPAGRHTEQHDIFFTVGTSLKDTLPAIKLFWPEAKEKIHIDAWRLVTAVNGYEVSVVEKESDKEEGTLKLFFINLGGYKKDEFDEPHYKLVLAAENMAGAIKQAKETAFYRHMGFSGAVSHIDDKYGVDVDDAFEISEVLPPEIKQKYSIRVREKAGMEPDEIHLGYLPLSKIS